MVSVLEERGLDPTPEFPKPLTDELARESDVIVTMSRGDTCPVYLGKHYLDWEVQDPAGKPVEAVRPISDDINDRVRKMLAVLT